MERYIYNLILLSFSLLLFANVKVIDTAGCNLAIVEETDTNTYSLKSTSGAHNWWSSVFNGLDTNNPTTFSLYMDGTGTPEFQGDVRKWEGLYPVFTYGKYWEYNTYIYYTKNDDGCWVSSDPFAKDRLASNGITPVQSVIQAELADEFLSADGNYWSPWQEIKDTKINAGLNTFTMAKQFNSPNAAVAMRTPYPYDFQHEYMTKLKKENIHGVIVHEIGKSIRRHNLYVVEISDPNATVEKLKERRVVLMYANEDGSEPDGSWVVNGAMNYLIQGIQNNDTEVNKILSEVTFLFVNMLDPVGWSNSTYGAMTYEFNYNDDETNRQEAVKYASFINNWCGDREMRLDVVMNFHNIECNEASSNLLCPLIDLRQVTYISELNKFILTNLSNIKTSETVWMTNFALNRFMNWCNEVWGSLQIPYEINSRYPNNRLSMKDLDNLGESFVLVINKYFSSDSYEKVLPHIDYAYDLHTTTRNDFLTKVSMFDIQTLKNYYTLEGLLSFTH